MLRHRAHRCRRCRWPGELGETRRRSATRNTIEAADLELASQRLTGALLFSVTSR